MPVEHELLQNLEREAAYDAQWIGENMHLFDPLAREGFAFCGRGAIVANTGVFVRRIYAAEGHPFNYRSAAQLEEWSETDEFTQMSQPESVPEMLNAYDPLREMVVVLLKDWRGSAYAIPLLAEQDRDTEIRGAYVYAEAEERIRRLQSPDPWAHAFRLASPHRALWPESERPENRAAPSTL